MKTSKKQIYIGAEHVKLLDQIAVVMTFGQGTPVSREDAMRHLIDDAHKKRIVSNIGQLTPPAILH